MTIFNATLKKVADSVGFKAVVRLDEVKVTITPDRDVIGEFVSALHGNATMLLNNNVVDSIPSIEELETYCNMLIKARVVQVTDGKLPLKPSSREWVIPAGFLPILAMVGPVIDRDESVRVTVNCDDDTVESVRKYVKENSTFTKIVRFFDMVEDVFTVARGLPRDSEGNYEFMMFQVVTQTLADSVGKRTLAHHNNKVEPAVVLAAAFIRAEALHALFAPRFIYGSVDDARYGARMLAKAKFEA